MPRRHDTGRLGEALAERHLAARGYAILARRYRTRRGEIDLIARTGEAIVFIEVKTRTSERFGGPFASLAHRQRARMAAAAARFLAENPRYSGALCRFDAIAVLMEGTGQPIVEHVEDAFRL
jgi:putative endonuclease